MITSTECERKEACPNPAPLLQPVLGTDKGNPIFSVYRQEGAAPSLHVYYGAELLEVVPEDRQHPAFKLLMARLYNAGVKGLALRQNFRVDRKTMRRWGQALQSEDAGAVGPGVSRPGRAAQAHARNSGLCHRALPRDLSVRVAPATANGCAREIKAVFGVTLSGECLRPLLKVLAGRTAPGIE